MRGFLGNLAPPPPATNGMKQNDVENSSILGNLALHPCNHGYKTEQPRKQLNLTRFMIKIDTISYSDSSKQMKCA